MIGADYIDKSIAVVSTLIEADLASMSLGEQGEAARSCTFISLGKVGAIHIGLKVPTTYESAAHRLSREMPSMNLVYSRIPEVRSLFPVFTGVLVVGRSAELDAIITEDVSEGGAFEVSPVKASPEARSALKEGLLPFDGDAVEEDILDNATAFEVNGQERWLDFTPSPIKLRALEGKLREEHMISWRKTRALKNKLTLTIPRDSRLASDLKILRENRDI